MSSSATTAPPPPPPPPSWQGITTTTTTEPSSSSSSSTVDAFRIWLTRPLLVHDAAKNTPQTAGGGGGGKSDAATATGSSSTTTSTTTTSTSSSSPAWQPLRHADCQALRRATHDGNHPHPVLIEGGRATADPVANLVFYNFFRGPQRQLCAATWFIDTFSSSSSSSSNNNTSSGAKDAQKKKQEAEEKDNKKHGGAKPHLIPIILAEDEDKIESLYQNTLLLIQEKQQDGNTTSTINIDEIVTASPEVTLSDGAKVRVVKQSGNSGSSLALRRTASGWFGATHTLQRGYGSYTIPGEAEEMALGPVTSLVFCIHGIGEAYFTKQQSTSSSSSSTTTTSSVLPTMIEQMNTVRIEVQKRQVQMYQKQCEEIQKKSNKKNFNNNNNNNNDDDDATTLPPPPGRIEFLPIEWFHLVHNDSSDIMQSLQAVTLSSIPALRSVANDVIFDILVYLTPRYCSQVLQCVTKQITTLYHAFCQVHPHFVRGDNNNNNSGGGGSVTLMGHSLGSVICWDLLAILQDHAAAQQKAKPGPGVNTTATTNNNNTMNDAKANQQPLPGATAAADAATATASASPSPDEGTWGPTLPEPLQETLPFTPDNVILMGSPLGMFLSLRGAHKVFDHLRRNHNPQQSTDNGPPAASAQGRGTVKKISPFTLPTTRFMNIFNIADPVAYRVEPLLLSPDFPPAKLPPPAYLVAAPGKDVRLHVKARQLSEQFTKSITDPSAAWSGFLGTVQAAVAASTTTAATEPAASHGGGAASSSTPKSTIVAEEGNAENAWVFPLGGSGGRVDYAFQPSLVDTPEYISAVLAHSTNGYFMNGDFLDWMVHHLPTKAIETKVSQR